MASRTIHHRGRVLHVSDNQPTFWDKFEVGSWEPETLAAIDRLVTPSSTFIDIGAWVGPTTLWAAFTARRVIALEADPAALKQLHANLAANPELSGRIEVIERALHVKSGSVSMGARRKPGDSMSSIHYGGGSGETTSWDAKAITPVELAGVLAGDDDIVLKMDVEGGEYGLLPVMQPVLGRVRAAMISFHPEILNHLGWRETRIKNAGIDAMNAFPAFDRIPLVKHDGRGGPSAVKEWLFIKKHR